MRHAISRFGAATLLLALLAALGGCVVVQFGSNQVPDVNVNFTELKDEDDVGMPAAIDTIVAAFLGEPGAPPGCAVGIMIDDQVAHLKGYGSARINGEPFTHGTPAVVGSVSKTWTALAVLRLWELGLLDLEDTISDFLPNAPPAWQSIRVDELLSHTSGLRRDPQFDPALDDEAGLNAFLFPVGPPIPHPGIHPRLVYYSFQQTPVVGFAPGSTARYSNTGYMLLGAIIDVVVRANTNVVGSEFASYESFVWRYVGAFDGTLSNGDQMLSQCLNEYWRQTDIPNLATGYTFENGQYTAVDFFSSSVLQLGPAGWEGPPGAWTMTIGDLTRLMVAIQNDAIVDAMTKAAMMQPLGSDSSGNWGLGVNLIEKLGRPVYMHDGAYPGFRARYTVWPDERFGVAIMCNESNTSPRDITDDIASFFIGGAAGTAGIIGGPTIDEDDPGLGAATSPSTDPPDLTAADQAAIALDVAAQQELGLRMEQDRAELMAALDAGGCPATVETLLAGTGALGPVDTRPFTTCFDESETEKDFEACVGLALLDLLKQGVIGPDTAAELQQCALYTYRFPCLADLNDDGLVGVGDLLEVLGAWGGPDGDVDGDGTTGVSDLLKVLADWGPCPE